MESLYEDLRFGIEKYALETYVKEHLDNFGIFQPNEEDEYWKILDPDLVCRMLANVIYPYTRRHYQDFRISSFNRVWGRNLYQIGGTVDHNLLPNVSLPNIDVFTTFFRKKFHY